jgi:hypothetical protein
MNQLKEFGKEFNIYQSKLKLFIIQKETIMLPAKVNTLKQVMLREVIPHKLNINKEQPMFHPKVELELKQSTKQVIFQFLDQCFKVNQPLGKED